MKIILCITLCLVGGIILGEETPREGSIRREMESFKWNTADISFQEVGKYGDLVVSNF